MRKITQKGKAAGIANRPDNPWKGKRKANWLSRYRDVKNILTSKEKYFNEMASPSLIVWFYLRRRELAEGKLPPEKAVLIQKLNEIFPIDKWRVKFDMLVAFRKAYPDKWPLSGSKSPDGFALGKWCRRVIVEYRGGLLNKKRVKLLKGIGFPFKMEGYKDRWMRQYFQLKAYRKKYPDRWPKSQEIFPSGNRLGLWLNHQRVGYRAGRLEQDRMKDLDRIGVGWRGVRKPGRVAQAK